MYHTSGTDRGDGRPALYHRKEPANSKTVTNIGLLDPDESIRELARILGGAKITETVLESAREMKELAARAKE